MEGKRRQKVYLKTLLIGLAACVSYISPEAHALLLAEIQTIALWEADQVCPCHSTNASRCICAASESVLREAKHCQALSLQLKALLEL